MSGLSKELLKIATLGTAHHGIDLSVLGEGKDSPERAFLRKIAGLMLREQVTRPLEVTNDPLETPCQSDNQVRCSPRSVSFLMKILGGQSKDIINEWFNVVIANGQRIPEEIFPVVIELGKQHRDLRDTILLAMGKRGQWIAESIEQYDWHWFNLHQIDQLWNESPEDRLALLSVVRRNDPAKSRELIQLALFESKYIEQFLELLAIDLSYDDEPLLEAILDIDDLTTRRHAAVLLARLPESLLRQRMRERAMSIELFRNREGSWELGNFDTTLDNSAKRDGMYEGGTSDGRLHWVQLVLSFVDPFEWCRWQGVAFEKLLENMDYGRLIDDVVLSLVMAGANTQNKVVANLVLERSKDPHDCMTMTRWYLYDLATDDTIERATIRMLKIDKPFDVSHPAHDFLRRTKAVWGEALTQAFLDTLERSMSESDSYSDSMSRHDLETYAQFIPLFMQDRFLSILSLPNTINRGWDDMIQSVTRLFEMRREMLASIQDL